MAFHEVQGSLFDAPAGYVIGHGCNMKGFMGSGIAVEFKKRWPDMYEWYHRLCKEGDVELGEIDAWPTHDPVRPYVINLYSQNQMGPNANFRAIFTSIYDSLSFVGKGGKLAIPRIGCGIGGQDWDKVKPMLEALANYWDDRDLYVYSI